MKFASRLVSFDPTHGDRFRPIATPVYQTATFEQEHIDSFGKYDYRGVEILRARFWKNSSWCSRMERAASAFPVE